MQYQPFTIVKTNALAYSDLWATSLALGPVLKYILESCSTKAFNLSLLKRIFTQTHPNDKLKLKFN